MRPDDKVSDDNRTSLKDARAHCPDPDELTASRTASPTAMAAVIAAYANAMTMLPSTASCLVRQRRGGPAGLDRHRPAGPVPELRGFANGLLNDLDAVRAGLTEAW